MKGFLKGNCTTTPLKPFFYWHTAFITHSLVSWLMINPRCGVVIKTLVPMPNKGKLGKITVLCGLWSQGFCVRSSTVQWSGRYKVVEQLSFPVAKTQKTKLYENIGNFVWECFASPSSVIGAHLCLKAVNNILPNFFCVDRGGCAGTLIHYRAQYRLGARLCAGEAGGFGREDKS